MVESEHICVHAHAQIHMSCCCGHSGRPVSTHRRISDSVSACEEGQQLLECSGGKGVGAVFLVVKAALGERYLGVLIVQCSNWRRRERRGKEEPRTSSLCALDSFGFMILEWLCQPGLMTAVSDGEVKSTENMF